MLACSQLRSAIWLWNWHIGTLLSHQLLLHCVRTKRLSPHLDPSSATADCVSLLRSASWQGIPGEMRLGTLRKLLSLKSSISGIDRQLIHSISSWHPSVAVLLARLSDSKSMSAFEQCTICSGSDIPLLDHLICCSLILSLLGTFGLYRRMCVVATGATCSVSREGALES